jgi:hypothetical protein
MLQMLSYDVTFNPPPLYRLDDYGAPPAAPRGRPRRAGCRGFRVKSSAGRLKKMLGRRFVVSYEDRSAIPS